MASKKEKILESAQRFVLKGQLDKAIKEYQQVVAMEPKEVRYRQRLAELLVRDNRKEEAIVQYEDIGKHYAENSYFLKAIAIYKQIQRLSPGNSAISLTIASLNHQQGLTGNAMAEYGQVLAQFEKEGANKEALKVVEKMLGVDAEHAATRLKYAELLFATGSNDDSWQTFSALVSSLRSGGHDADAEVISGRMRRLFPEQQEGIPAVEPPVSGDAPLMLDGFGPSDEVPGVADQVTAPWEAEASEQAPVLPEWDAGASPAAAEPPDAFEHSFPAPEPAAVTDPHIAFGAPWESEAPAASRGADAPELASAWEEEIELDLDDDFSVGLSACADPAPADFAATLEPVPSCPAAAPDPVASYAEGAPDSEMDLHLDFSLNLDFDEVVESLEDAPLDDASLDEAHHAVIELDLEEEGSLELSLPQECEAFGDLQWSEEAEELAEPEELAEHVEATGLEEAEELAVPLDAAEPEASGASDWSDAPDLSERGAGGEEPRGWDEVYPGTGEPDQSELDIEELESHYDLGIGYKEMGLYSGAIKEFDVAARNPQRRVDCLTLQAICYREKGEPAMAEELLRLGLSLDVLSREERLCLSYELAFLLESTGVLDEAIGLYREVSRANPGFHDASRRLSTLSGEEHLDIIELELEEGN